MAKKQKDKEQEPEEREPRESSAEKRSKIANSIMSKNKFLTLRDSEELLYFNSQDGEWHDGETYLKEFLIKETSIAIDSDPKTGIIKGTEFTTSMFREIREIIKIQTYSDPKGFVCPPEWINLKNGALNVLTSEFIARDPMPLFEEELKEINRLKNERDRKIKEVKDTPGSIESDKIKDSIYDNYNSRIKYIMEKIIEKKQEWQKSQTVKFAKFCFTSSLPVKFDPSANCPKIDAFFKSLELADDVTDALIELFGYCLYKEYPIKKMFIFLGPHDTAKSTVASLLEELLGERNYTGLSLDAMMEDRFEMQKLYRKYANISGELASRFIKDTALLKKLMGSNAISARLMHSQLNFMFRNFAKLIFLANQIPATYDSENDYFNKVLIFEFRKQFIEGEKGTRDRKKLMTELTTEEEMSGLLNKSVNALQELLKRMKFKTSKSEQENKELYRIKSDPFRYYVEEGLWFNDGIQEIDDLDGSLIKSYKLEVYGNFLAFCNRYKIPAMPEKKFFSLLKDYMKKHNIEEKRDSEGRYYSGVYVNNLWVNVDKTASKSDSDDLL